ncbi:MAG TPA: cell division protein ZapA [Candidatus Kapabacteria bacterium]|jgi:cell division protein ZapA (FtsZ GTPase activity inhibitor)
MAQTVKVTILGAEYPLRSNDESLTQQLAQDVDAQLRELQTKLPAQSTTTLAVLSALNFAEQEAHAKENERRDLDRTAMELETLTAALEQAME